MKKLILPLLVTASAAFHCNAQLYTLNGAPGQAEQNSTTYGITFIPDVDVTISDVGAFVYGGYTVGDIQLTLWKQGDSNPVSTSTMHVTAGNVSGFKYVFENADFGGGFTPVTLSAGSSYALVLNHTGAAYYRAPGSYTTQSASSSGISFKYIVNPGVVVTENPFIHSQGFSDYSTPLGSFNMIIAPASVPEPTLVSAAVGLGLVGFAAYRRIRR